MALIEDYALIGDLHTAALVARDGDVGMPSEEYDTAAGRHRGNTPQTFSLVGLINSARQLSGQLTTTNANRHHQQLHAE